MFIGKIKIERSWRALISSLKRRSERPLRESESRSRLKRIYQDSGRAELMRRIVWCTWLTRAN